MVAPLIIAGVIAAGTLMSMAAKKKQNENEQASLLDQAEARKEQALEGWQRSYLDRKLVKEQGEQIIGKQLGSYAKSGVDITKGAPLTTISDTIEAMVSQINRMEREAIFDKGQLMKGASIAELQASRVRSAGKFDQLSTGLSGAASAYGAYKG